MHLTNTVERAVHMAVHTQILWNKLYGAVHTLRVSIELHRALSMISWALFTVHNTHFISHRALFTIRGALCHTSIGLFPCMHSPWYTFIAMAAPITAPSRLSKFSSDISWALCIIGLFLQYTGLFLKHTGLFWQVVGGRFLQVTRLFSQQALFTTHRALFTTGSFHNT